MLRAGLVFAVACWSAIALANEDAALRTRYFSYPPAVLGDLGSALSSDVVLRPEVDRRRAYLLDISEEEIVGAPAKVVRDAWDRVRNGMTLSPLKGPLVADRIKWYAQRKELVESISQRSRRYLFHVVEAVERRGLPMEIALLPFVESGFEPQALSSAKAAGLWQFIPGTAQRYKLKLNDHYDARRDIVASTEAALDYLEFLHGMFKDWHLALAAYNWGEEAVQRAIQRNQARRMPTDYESLVMPEETKYYVPKLMAISTIVSNPERYGIRLADVDNAPYFAAVNVPVELDVQAVAKLANLSVAEVLALNPSHKTRFISGKGRPDLLLPSDRVAAFADKLAALPAVVRAKAITAKPKAAKKPLARLKMAEGLPL